MTKVYITRLPYSFPVYDENLKYVGNHVVEVFHLHSPDDHIYFEGELIKEDEQFIWLKLQEGDQTMHAEFIREAISINEKPNQKWAL